MLCILGIGQLQSPALTTAQAQSCDKGELWRPTLSPELRTRLGATTRRGSAPVIDTYRANHIAHLSALIQSQRSVSPTPRVPEIQSQLSPTEFCSEAEDGFPPQGTLPLLQVTPVSLPSTRRLSDTCVRPSSESTSVNLAAPVPGGRRHSDLSSLISLTSHHNHLLTMQRGQTCQACLSLLHVRSCETSNRHSSAMPAHPYDLNPGFGRQGFGQRSDCSDFLLLQKSLYNIISGKSMSCQTTHTSLLHPSAVCRPACSDGDGTLKKQLLGGNSVGDQETPQDCMPLNCAEEQVARDVGVVGH